MATERSLASTTLSSRKKPTSGRTRAARAGLRRSSLNGPRTLPNTPTTASTTAWCSAGTSDLPVTGGMRGMRDSFPRGITHDTRYWRSPAADRTSPAKERDDMRRTSRIALFAALAAVAMAAGPAAPADTAALDRRAVDFTVPAEIKWVKNAAGTNESAVLFGDPSKPGPYVVRVRWLPAT